jgi:hypothetical protein
VDIIKNKEPAPPKTENLGVAILTPELVSELLGLADGHRIVGVRSEQDNCIGILITGPDCPEIYEGETIPTITLSDGKVDG